MFSEIVGKLGQVNRLKTEVGQLTNRLADISFSMAPIDSPRIHKCTSGSSFFHCPSYLVPFVYLRNPTPFLIPASHLPLNLSPVVHV